MAQESKNLKNSVHVKGFLKENTLQTMVTKTGKPAISGVLTIAVTENEDYRIRYMVCQTTSMGKENAAYKSLEKLLPSNTCSIATYLKANPDATFAQACQNVTLVWAQGSFELYDRKDDKGVVTSVVTVRGINAGIASTSVERPFDPHASFVVEAYVEAIKDEKKDGEETGRVILTLDLVDTYKDVIYPIDVICESDSAKQQVGYFSKGDTSQFEGTLRSLRQEVIIPGKKVEYLDGSTSDSTRKTYTFVNERLLVRALPPYGDEDVKKVSTSDIRRMAANRQKTLDELAVTTEKAASHATAATTNAAPSDSVKGFVL